MHSKSIATGLVLLVMIATILPAGCCTPMRATVADRDPALLGENVDGCIEAIEDAMERMLGKGSVRLSPDAFRTQATVRITTTRTGEAAGDTVGDAVSEKEFLLHAKSGQCYLSLVDEAGTLADTERIGGCTCVPAP